MGRVARVKAERRTNRSAGVQLTESDYRILKAAMNASEEAGRAASQVKTVARALFNQAQAKYQFDGDSAWTFDDATCRLVPVQMEAQPVPPQTPPK